MSEMKYLVVTEDASGDRWEEVYETAEKANCEAAYAWSHLTDREKQKTNVCAVLVRREWLNEDAVDEDTGEVDWRMFDRADSFPGAFDSDDADAMREAAKRWEANARAVETYDHISLDLGRIYFDCDRKFWVCPAEIDDSRAELTLDGGEIVVSVF